MKKLKKGTKMFKDGEEQLAKNDEKKCSNDVGPRHARPPSDQH